MSNSDSSVITLSGSDDDDADNFKVIDPRKNKPSLPFSQRSSSKKERDKIEVKVRSKNYSKDEDLLKIKQKLGLDKKKKKTELPNVFSHKAFARSFHSRNKTKTSTPDAEIVVLDEENDKAKNSTLPAKLGNTNLVDIIVTGISPKSSKCIAKRSKLLEKALSSDKTTNGKGSPNFIPLKTPSKNNSLIHLPLNRRYERIKSKYRKGEKNNKDRTKINCAPDVGNKSKECEVEIVQLDEEEEKVDNNNKAVQENKEVIEERMECVEDENKESKKDEKSNSNEGEKQVCMETEKQVCMETEKQVCMETEEIECNQETENQNQKPNSKHNEVSDSKESEKPNCSENVKPKAKRKREEEKPDIPKEENVVATKKPKNEDVTIQNVPEIYKELVALLESTEKNQRDREKALNKIIKHHNLADPNYTSSPEFRQLLKESCSTVKEINSPQLYTIIGDILTQLKSAKNTKLKKRVELKSAPDAKASTDKKDTLEELEDPEEAELDPAIELKNRRKIKRLSRSLKTVGKIIKELEEAEVDLDDEMNSNYLKLQKYRERYCKIHEKYCLYSGISADAGRAIKSKISYSGTKFPAVNKCIEKWLNKTRRFPDFNDILKLIEHQNNVDKQLALTPEGIRTLATETFVDVGEMLKRMRLYDFRQTFFAYLDDKPANDDPANDDPELAECLRKNVEEGQKKITEILDFYSEKQLKEHYTAVEVPDEEADCSPVESGDEDEKEIEEVENSLIVSEDEAQDDKKEKLDEGPSTSGKSDETAIADPPPLDTLKIAEDVSPVRESKNNYKHCKSLKWRRENSSNLNNTSDFFDGDSNKPVSDGDTNDLIPEKGESLLKDDEDDVEKPITNSVSKVAVTKPNDLIDRKKEVDCEIIDVDSPVMEVNDNTYEQLKTNFNSQTYFVNYVRVEYFSKGPKRELLKNNYDKSALLYSTNLDDIIHLNDDGYRDSKVMKKNKENRSPNFLKRKTSKMFNVSFRKRISKNLFITKCVLENKENNGVNGEGQGKEQEESSEAEKNEEMEEAEAPAGNNGSGNGEGGEDNDGDDKDSKEVAKDEEEEEDKEEEDEKREEEEEDEVRQEEEEDEVRQEKEEKKDREEECLNGNYDADTDEDETGKTVEAEDCSNDFDKKLKAFEDALEDDEEDEFDHEDEEQHNKGVDEEKVEKNNYDEVQENKLEKLEVHENEEKDEEDKTDENMEQDKVETTAEEDEIPEKMETDNSEDIRENGEEDHIDEGENVEEQNENSNDSKEKEIGNEDSPDNDKRNKSDEEALEDEPIENEKNLNQNGDSSDKVEDSALEEGMDVSEDKSETKTESEDINETESKTEEEEKNEDEKPTNEDADSKPENEDSEQTKEEDSTEPNDEEPGPSSKRKTNEATDVEVLSFKKPKTSTKTDPLDEEIVQNFLRHSPSSISITPPKKFSKPPSQEALNALATLRQMKSISTTRVTRKPNEDDVQVIGESSIRRIRNNGPISITRVKRNQLPQNNTNSRNRGVPVISNVQSMNRNNSLTPKIVTVQGNVSGFHNARNFNFGMPRMFNMNSMSRQMNSMNMNLNIPGFNNFPRFNNFSMFNNRQQPPLKISNVRGNISQTFRPQLQQQHQQQPRRFPNPSSTSVRQPAPTPTSTATKDKSKKPVEYVVLE